MGGSRGWTVAEFNIDIQVRDLTAYIESCVINVEAQNDRRDWCPKPIPPLGRPMSMSLPFKTTYRCSPCIHLRAARRASR